RRLASGTVAALIVFVVARTDDGSGAGRDRTLRTAESPTPAARPAGVLRADEIVEGVIERRRVAVGVGGGRLIVRDADRIREAAGRPKLRNQTSHDVVGGPGAGDGSERVPLIGRRVPEPVSRDLGRRFEAAAVAGRAVAGGRDSVRIGVGPEVDRGQGVDLSPSPEGGW